MSVIPPSQPFAPIQSIDDDVLMYIFTLNADIFSDGPLALHTTRHTSQVCHRWRSLVVDSPSMWAKLDLDAFHSASTHKWLEEIIRRSGAAPLWITGHLFTLFPTDKIKNLRKVFFNLISGNWHRIQILIVPHIPGSFNVTHSMLRFPAPQLVHFDVSLTPNPMRAGVLDNPLAPIFANHAPLLRRFCLKGYIIDPCTPWLGHLVSIRLDKSYNLNDSYSISNALAVLSVTHNLQELWIGGLVNGESSEPLPVVTLPHLKSLYCRGAPEPYTGLLGHVKIPPGCSLAISIDDPPLASSGATFAERKQQLLSVVNIFNSHAERSLQSHIFNTIHLNYKPRESISFDITTALVVGCSLRIYISLRSAFPHPSIPSAVFLNRLGQLDLSSITRLQFEAEGPLGRHFELNFFSCLPSLDTICVNIDTIEYLTELQIDFGDTRSIFPFLKVIEFDILSISQVEAAAEFLLLRFQNEHPIPTLDTTKHSLIDASSLDALEEVKGLKVLYKLEKVDGIFEHICGSSDPAKRIDTI